MIAADRRHEIDCPETLGYGCAPMRSIGLRAPGRCGRAAIVLVATLIVAGCQRTEPDRAPQTGATTTTDAADGEVVATYAGKNLTRGELMRQLASLNPRQRVFLAAPERKTQFLENTIMNNLLFEEGQKAGYEKDPDIERQVHDLRKRLVVQQVMRKYQTPPTVSDEQVRKYYDENPALYSTTQIKASHILVKDEDTAKQILAEARAHPDRFADLAKEKSTDTSSAQKGGDLGMFYTGRMVAEFERVAFALKPGEISDVVKTQYGYHIFMVTERKEGEAKPFEQVKEQIRTTLRNKGLQEQVQGHLDSLKQQAKLTVNQEALARVNPAEGLPPGEPLPLSPGGH